MNILKIGLYISIALIVMLLIIALYLQISYTLYNPKIKFEVQESDLAYFNDKLDESRNAYLQMAAELSEKFDGVEIGKMHVPSKVDNNLYIDYCYIPQKDADKIMVMVSGIHGTEGFIGSAMQQLFVKEYLDQHFVENSALLLIHGMNPYGFKYNRRVTENNVDLNRNSHVDPGIFNNENPGYEMVGHIINPVEPVRLKDPLHKYFVFYAFKMIVQKGMNTLRQAIMQGQYSSPKGIYFGGKAFEPQVKSVHDLIDTICEPYNTIFALDLHSGYGQRGKVHLFLNPFEEQIMKRVEDIFEGIKIDWGGQETFYSSTGTFVDFVGMINPEKTFIPMLFEFGTLNSQSTFGSLKSLHNTILENQGNHYGYVSESDRLEVQSRFSEMFYPESAAWRSSCCAEFRRVMDVGLQRYLDY